MQRALLTLEKEAPLSTLWRCRLLGLFDKGERALLREAEWETSSTTRVGSGAHILSMAVKKKEKERLNSALLGILLTLNSHTLMYAELRHSGCDIQRPATNRKGVPRLLFDLLWSASGRSAGRARQPGRCSEPA